MYKIFNKLFETIEKEAFIDYLKNKDAELYFVGGCVRDCFLNKPPKDIDILVRKIPINILKSILNSFGSVKETGVGDKFGVIKFKSKLTNLEYDLSLPRKEVKTNTGHTGFDVFSDPDISVEDDLSRRDFTINAIALDFNRRIIDPFDGISDITNKLIRKVSDSSFSDDPLRMLRGVQFHSRFDDFEFVDETKRSIIENSNLINQITSERILEELDKIFYKGNIVKGIKSLRNTRLFNKIFGNYKPSYIYNINTREDFYYCLLFDNIKYSDLGQRFMSTLKGDKNTANIINSIYFLMNKNNDDVIHNMMLIYKLNHIYNNLYKSGIISTNKKLVSAFNKLEKYPKSLKELKVNGNDFKGHIPDKYIGLILDSLMKQIYEGLAINQRADLLSAAKVIIKKLKTHAN